ncbi:hypothetical protein CR513_08240, partial [Mucuna pruriens]
MLPKRIHFLPPKRGSSSLIQNSQKVAIIIEEYRDKRVVNRNPKQNSSWRRRRRSESRAGIKNREARSGSLRSGPGLIQAVGAVVPDGPKLVGGGVESEPLLHLELFLGAGLVGPSGGNLNVVKVPAVVRTRSVRGYINGA